MKTQKMTAYERNHELDAVMHEEVRGNYRKLQKAVDIMNELGELDNFAEVARKDPEISKLLKRALKHDVKAMDSLASKLTKMLG